MSTAPHPNVPSIISRFFEAKARKGISFEKLAAAVGRDEIWVAAAFYGQAKLSGEEIQALANALDISLPSQSELDLAFQWWPHRGFGPVPPTDPIIYRLYESILVYGHAIKAIIHEKFGDGIMSMIDCKVNVSKKPDPNGDRVVLTFDGKFLPYAKW